MITRVVAFALHQRFVILALAALVVVGGIVAYDRLPIEAYPDVGAGKVRLEELLQDPASFDGRRLVLGPARDNGAGG